MKIDSFRVVWSMHSKTIDAVVSSDWDCVAPLISNERVFALLFQFCLYIVHSIAINSSSCSVC